MKILFLGNSITRHEPKPDIKWFNDFGMAASCIENDYVHQCVDMLKKRFPVDFRLRNIAVWEREFCEFDYSTLDAEKKFGCDVLVMRISENIDQAYAEKNDFKTHYLKLTDYVRRQGAKVVTSTNFWGADLNLFSDRIIREVSKERGYPCAELNALGKEKENKGYPYGSFTPPYADEQGVCEHPGDSGMKKIAQIIADIVSRLF